MADTRDLRINTLDRYVKRSERLILESYSSCEVPLGCGGALCRWIDPTQSIPLLLTMDLGDREATVLLDGERKENARIDVSPGKHVLALIFAEVDGPLSLRLKLDYDKTRVIAGALDERKQPSLVTRDDGTWYATTRTPVDGWATSTHPVDGWLALRAMPIPTRKHPFWNESAFAAAASIGLETSAKTVWVRRVFKLEVDEHAWVLS
jgi:hypothetical protein